MRFDGPEGSLLDLSVVGYQFPNMVAAGNGFDHDANWLVIAGDVNSGDRAWQFRDACLLTVELRELAAWFEAIADRRVLTGRIDFTEPNLAFQRVSGNLDQRSIRVTFELEARPAWHRMTSDGDDWGAVWLEFPMTADVLRTAARELRSDLERFPERGQPLSQT